MTNKTDRASAAVRMRVMKRDRFKCTYCGAPGTDAELEVDHIIAVANGGSNHISTYENLHRGKIGAHWLWCVIERVAAGEDDEAVLREYGFSR